MSESLVTFDPAWGRGVYVNGELSTWGKSPIAATAHQTMFDIVSAIRGGAIHADWDVTIAVHQIGEGTGTMMVIRLRATKSGDAQIAHDAIRKLITDFVHASATKRARTNAIVPTTYVGMIMFANAENKIVGHYTHML